MNVYIVLLIQTLLASATHIIAKTVVRDVDAVTLTFLRSVISSAGLLLFAVGRGSKLSVDRTDWKLMIILAILATVNQLLYLYGINFTTAANAALLYAATPVFVLILSFFLLGEQITMKKAVGISLAFIGVTVVILERGISFATEYTYGNLVILAAVICWALFTIRGKPMVLKYGAVTSTTLATVLGGALFFPIGIVPAAQFPYRELNSLDWAGVFYLGIGTSILGYFLWYYALKRIDATKLAVFSNGQPIGATILSLIFLDYTITTSFVVGGVITIVGVIITQLN